MAATASRTRPGTRVTVTRASMIPDAEQVRHKAVHCGRRTILTRFHFMVAPFNERYPYIIIIECTIATSKSNALVGISTGTTSTITPILLKP